MNYKKLKKSIQKWMEKCGYSELSRHEAFTFADSLYLFGFLNYTEYLKIENFIFKLYKNN